jgi:spermidine/putrescine transport system substrate-binding protein
MKKLLSILLSALLFCGCSKKETLHIYTWSDYINLDFIAKFEKDNNCKVIIDTFDSNETMYAKLKAGVAGYDICFPTEYFISLLKNENIIDELDLTKLPNVKNNIDYRFCKRANSLKYYIPYAFSYTGILYRKDKFPNLSFQLWNEMFTINKNVRICMFDDIREVIGLALKECGYSVNSTNKKEIAYATKIACNWKQAVVKMDNESYKTGIANGEIDIAMGYNADAIQLMAEMGDNIGFIVPTLTGTTSSMDTITILKLSKNKELAYKFINALYEKETAIKNCEYICAPMPIQNLTESLSNSFKYNKYMIISDKLLKQCETINNVGLNIDMYNKAWDKIKSVR